MTQQLQSFLGRLAGASGMLGVGAWVLNESLYNVDGGHAAVIWSRFGGGVQPFIMEEGSHFSAWRIARVLRARAQFFPPLGRARPLLQAHFPHALPRARRPPTLRPTPASLCRDPARDVPHRV